MSAKWRRSKAWDDRFFPAWAWPAKAVLRALSSIPLAVALLSLVVLYGSLASVPVGLIALGLTWAVYGMTALGVILLVVTPGVLILRRSLGRAGRGTRFAVTVLGGLALATVAIFAWSEVVWPALRFNPHTGDGFRLFPQFVETYKSTTIRRLPALEMTEGQFYGWWPLRAILFLFVINLVVATLRRIEIRFVNIGVLTVHTGIVVLALGSIYYQSLKQEGDVLLLASAEPGAPGPLVTTFMDRVEPALWASLDGAAWSVAPLPNLPRYNDYGEPISDRSLSIDLPMIPPATAGAAPISARVSGYGSYVELEEGWTPDPGGAPGSAPMVDLTLLSALGPDPATPVEPRPIALLRLPAGSPKDRLADLAGAIFVEHVEPGDPRWAILDLPMPPGAERAIVVFHDNSLEVKPAIAGAEFLAGGNRVRVREVHDASPFPIITPGYEGADSSVAILDITTPAGETFERWVFHRFPELDQDIHGVREDGRPDRRPADPAIRLTMLDAGAVQVYIRGDEAISRTPDGRATRHTGLAPGVTFEPAPRVLVRVDSVYAAASRRETPIPVPEAERRKDYIGTHDRAAIALELSAGAWRETHWLPFARYMNVSTGADRRITLPDGRTLRVAFSRAPRSLPGMGLRLLDFEMIAYPHSDIPRDYLSNVQVADTLRVETSTAITRLNRPLIHRVPFRTRDGVSFVGNAIGAVVSMIAPNRYKFSQSGWDAEGWRESVAQVEAGALDRPRAMFTILAVGNNPGIHVIAVGGVMVCAGIPWAFYIKPWLLRRQRDRLAKLHAGREGARIEKPAPARREPEPVAAGSASG